MLDSFLSFICSSVPLLKFILSWAVMFVTISLSHLSIAPP
jgi:hypothetical protein